MKKEIMCLYHAHCNDGIAAAAVVYTVFGEDCEYIAMSYGDPVPDVTGKQLFIVDFSFKRDIMEQILLDADTTVVLDHHVSAQNELKDLELGHADEIIFDMERSGAKITWDYFYSDLDLTPTVINLVQDRDLWRFNLEQTNAFFYGVQLHTKTVKDWATLIQNTNDLSPIFTKGKAIIDYNEALLANVDGDTCRKTVIGVHRVPFAPCTHLMSEVTTKLAKNHPFACTYRENGDKRQFSLRSTKESNFDVSQIAEIYGGGGHKNAAGFVLPISKLYDHHPELI